MVEMNKNFYDPTLAHMVPQHKLEIWPGYVTAVAEYEGGLMLNLDVSHKVLRTQTAHDLVSLHYITLSHLFHADEWDHKARIISRVIL